MSTWTPSTLRTYLLSSLNFRGGDYPNLARAASTAARWYVPLHNQLGFQGLPFFLVMDLGFLLIQGRDFPFRCLREQDSTSLEQQYQNRVLNALLNTPGTEDLRQSGQPTNDKWVVRALEMLLAPHLTDKVFSPHLPSLDGSVLKEVFFPEEIDLPKVLEQYRDDQGSLDIFSQALEDFVRQFSLRSPQDIWPTIDLWELSHLEAFPSTSARKIGRQLRAIMENISPYSGDPLPFAGKMKKSRPLSPIKVTIPKGGIAQLARRGSWENLVPSELVYMDSNTSTDLFDLRYSERELLFYQRDSLEVRRKRRSVHFLLDDFSSLANYLAPAAPETAWEKESPVYKLSTLVTGFVFRLMADLKKVYARDACQFYIHFSAPSPPPEARIAEAMFRRERERQELEVITTTPLDFSKLTNDHRLVYAIYFSSQEHSLPSHPGIRLISCPLQPWHQSDSELWNQLPQIRDNTIAKIIT